MLDSTAITAPVGAMSSSLPRHCMQAAMMPASLTCMANAVTASAIANRPKSAGVSSLASTSPSANEPTFAPKLPSRLHVNPRPALRPILPTCSAFVSPDARSASSDTLKPDLPPERNELAWATRVVHAGTHHVLQDDAGVLHRQQLAGLLVQTLRHPRLHPCGAAAVAGHLLLEAHASVEHVLVEGRLDLLLGLDADHFARL